MWWHKILFAIPIVSAVAFFLTKRYSKEIAMLREVSSLISWRTFVDFLIYKARENASHFLETGHITKRKSPNGNVIEVTFFDGSQKHKFAFIKPRGPSNIRSVTSIMDDLGWEEHFDVTSEIRSYVGCLSNLSPVDLGYQTLVFVLSNGTEHKFSGRSRISF